MQSIWDLPGGRAFITEMRDRVERGDHLTLTFPNHLEVQPFVERFRDAVPWMAHEILHIDAGRPLDQVLDCLHVHTQPGEMTEIQNLMDAPEVTGVLLWLIGASTLAPSERVRWADFVASVASATRRTTADLTLQIILVDEGDGDIPSPSEPGWSSAAWWGRLGRLDTALHVEQAVPGINASLRASAVEIAAYDVALAERLAIEQAHDLEEIVAVLRDEAHFRSVPEGFATERVPCGSGHPGDLHGAWTQGLVEQFDGEPHAFWHSCLFLQTEGGLATLRRRLWRGQVREDLPRLEEWRVQLVEVAKREHYIATGIRLDELDFRELHQHLQGGEHSPRRRELTDFAGWLRRARNRIAHLDALDSTTREAGERLAEVCLR